MACLLGALLIAAGIVGFLVIMFKGAPPAKLPPIAIEEASVPPGDPIFNLLWIEYDCSWAGSKLPEALHPIVCVAAIRVYRSNKLDKVIKRLEKLGPTRMAVIYEERGVKEKRISIVWRASRA